MKMTDDKEPKPETKLNEPPADPAVAAPPEESSDALWTNRDWAVTEFGLESRCVINGRRLPGDFSKTDLLRQRQGQPGIANAALHLAEKQWVNDPDALVDALAAALDIHHPAQKVIDVDATREEARRVWHRSRRSPGAGDPDDVKSHPTPTPFRVQC